MDGNRRWLGWIAIGLAAVALLVALSGRGLGLQSASGYGGPNMQQYAAQQGNGPQNTAPQSAVLQNRGPRAGDGAPNAAGPQNTGPQNTGPRHGGASGPNDQRGPEQPRDGGFGLGGWLGFPLRLLGGSFKIALLALLILFGVWLIGGRRPGVAAAQHPQPAQEPESPTGEFYTDEPTDQE